MKRVLVSGASGIVGYGILRSLRSSGCPYFLLGTSIYEDSVAPAFCDAFEKAPYTNSSGYIEWLISAIKTHDIDIIIPGIEADMYRWSENLCEIKSSGALPLLNKPELIALCKDKWLFYEMISAAGISCAIESSIIQDYLLLTLKFGPRFLLKPRCGFGSKGIAIVECAEEFDSHVQNVGAALLAQPVVGSNDEEYTTAVICDGKGGYFSDITLRRKLSSEGYTDRAEVVNTDCFRASIDQLCELLKPIGPTNFQFRLCEDGPKLLEINPRVSSSTSIRAAFGFNESTMSIDYFLSQIEPVQPLVRRGHAIRYTDEHIFYEDGIYL